MEFENIMLIVTVVLVVAMIVLWILNCRQSAKKSSSTGFLAAVSVLGVLIIVICSLWRFEVFEGSPGATQTPIPTQTTTPDKMGPTPTNKTDIAPSETPAQNNPSESNVGAESGDGSQSDKSQNTGI